MLDQDFCIHLEHEITKALANSPDMTINRMWCDGVLLPVSDNQISNKFVNDKREVTMTAFIGVDGQDRYTLILKFGSKSLSKYARNLDIKECVPGLTRDDWFNIDTTKKIVTIHLT